MKNERLKFNAIDIIIYTIFIVLTLIDFIFSVNQDKDIFVCITFLIIGISSVIFFITDKGGITVDKIIYIFMYLFCYYAPYHQYLDNYIIHGNITFSNNDYLFANIIILNFVFIYTIFKRFVFKKTKIKKIKYQEQFSINTLSLTILLLANLISIITLYKLGLLFSLSEKTESAEGIYITLIRMGRFLPVASLLIYIFGQKKNAIKSKDIIKKIFLYIISIINIIMYFPLNGTIGRYLLFGTYIMIFYAVSKKIKYKSLILIVTSIGFYFIFPAFNFFKTHTILELNQFKLGGFNTNFIDYDAYQLLMLAVRFTEEHGILYGTNIISAILCIIPRSIFTKKLNPSGQIIGTYFNFKFTNISCPLFAEFYVAGRMFFLILGTIAFAYINKLIEEKMKNDSILFNGIYCISIGIIISIMRGALLPTMSIYMCLIIVYCMVYEICKLPQKRRKNIEF